MKRSISRLLAVALAGAACASGSHQSLDESVLPVPRGLTVSDFPSQRLFRLQVANQERSANLRLIVRIESPERLQLEAMDLLGKKRWQLDLEDAEVLIWDNARGASCRALDSERLPGLGIEFGSVLSAVEILLGRLPSSLQAAGVGRPGSGFMDRFGRVWSARAGGGGTLESWTAKRDGRPEMWWRRSGSGGILSHRDGIQLRWEEARTEALKESLSGPSGPQLGESVDCKQLVDQSFDSADEGL